MKTFIFVDLENIHYIGIRGIMYLTNLYKVFIFYSDNSNTIRIETYEELRDSKAEIEFIKITSLGANALDFQLATFLGTIAEKAHGSKLLIVSKDKSFIHIIKFCQEYLTDYNLKLAQFDSVKDIIYEESINQKNHLIDDEEYLFLAK